MNEDLHRLLDAYADLAIRTGLNLQPGQRLLITGYQAGVVLPAAPLVRRLAASAYQAGARRVDVLWDDEETVLARFKHAPRDSFDEFPTWVSEGVVKHVEDGGALLMVMAANMDLLNGQDPALVAATQRAAEEHFAPVLGLIGQGATNWLVIGAAAPGWADAVFPEVPAEQREARLWQAILRTCRADQPHPAEEWERHLADLARRSHYLTRRQYRALRYRGPGTDLTVGLPSGHVWHSGRLKTREGVPFTANMPTEEVFTLPHRDRVDGTVRATRPLPYGGVLIEDFSLTFEAGRVTRVSAGRGEDVLRSLVDTDEGAARLGEVALVPHSSPVSQSGLLFFNPLFDENAACHLALGKAYPFTLSGGEAMSDQELAAAGANHSMVHADFMIGSAQLDIGGVTEAGSTEPILQDGEWAFSVD